MVAALVSLLVVSACEHDFYETGDSELSYLHTDFVEARTNELGAFVSAKTDDGEELTLSPAVKSKWATRPDTTYRALLYYDRVEKGVTTSFALNPVLVLRPHLTFDLASVSTDPLGFESLWMSKNRKYLNLTLVLKSGQTDDKKSIQSLALVCDSIRKQASGGRKFYLPIVP